MTERREHLAGGRPWRWVFESLRAAQDPASLVPNLLRLTSTIVHCCSQVPPHEVADDVTLIVQAVSDRWLPVDGAAASRICRSTCIFTRSVLQCQQPEFTRDSWVALMHFFQGTITSAAAVILLGEEGGAEAGKARVEAVAALGQFLVQALDGGLLGVEDVSEVVVFLSGLMQCAATPAPSSSMDEVEVQRLAFVVMGSLMSKARPLVSSEAWTSALQALLVILDSLASKKAVVEDYAASRYYVDLLRCVHITVSKPEERLKEHVGASVLSLRMFFHYGLNGSQGETWQEKETGRVQGTEGLENTADSFSFSPSETPGEGVAAAEADFRGKSAELRMYSTDAIQAIIRADPEGVQKWSPLLLLPDNLEHSRSDEATLLSVLRFEPLAKIRVAAATTLLAMLELWPCLQDTGLTQGLSGCERQMFLGLQAGLVHTILNEKHNGTLLAALKALRLFISRAPFSQLPLDLLSNCVLSITKRLRGSNYFLTRSSVLTAAISCIRASLSIPPSSTLLPTESSNLILSRSLLVELITYSQAPAPTSVQTEAIQALKAAAHNYPRVFAPYWDDIFKVLVRVIDSGTLQGSDDACLSSTSYAKSISPSGLEQSSHDELIRSAIELLDELLRVAPDIEVQGKESAELLCSPRFGAHENAPSASEQGEEEGSLQWLLALERLLPGVLRHSSPMVRGAGLSCLAGLTPAVFCSLPAPKQEFILSTIMRASEYDDTPAVRSAACRAVGVIVGFPQSSKSLGQVAAFMSTLISRMEHSSTPERISASWALAHICDGLCSYCASLDLMEAEKILGHLPIESLLACISKAAEGADIEVCVHASRVLGKLVRMLNFNGQVTSSGIEHETLHDTTSSDWLGMIVRTFLSLSASENVEVQWNICQAVGNLFHNRRFHLSTSLWSSALFGLLHSLLCSSESLEVKMHAAAALEVPGLREDYGTAFGEAVHVFAHILSSMDIIANTGSAIEPAAKDQLVRTLLHLLGLGVPEDYLILKDVLEEFARFFQRQLSLSVLAAHKATAQQAVKALIAMCIYGGNVSIAKKFQALL